MSDAAPFPSPTKKWHDKSYPAISPTRPELSAKGKTVVVTGGGTGIGAETARSFAQAGASQIALLGRREQPLLDTKASIEQEFPDVEVFVASTDVTDKSQVDSAFDKFVGDAKDKRKIDILISNAATVGPQVPLADVDVDKFIEAAAQQNLRGSLNVAQAFLRHAATSAIVIEINSSVGHLNFAPGFGAYSISKFAIFRLWDTLAFENPGLTVFHVQPGVVDTAMNRESGGIDAVGFSDHGKSKYLSALGCMSKVARKADFWCDSLSTCELQCLARKPRGAFLERQVPVGKLGRGRTQSPSRGDPGRYATEHSACRMAVSGGRLENRVEEQLTGSHP
jgi:NAD(P)-dependent dehydrogenase (short-subunit alcohol dehydrogenase family)